MNTAGYAAQDSQPIDGRIPQLLAKIAALGYHEGAVSAVSTVRAAGCALTALLSLGLLAGCFQAGAYDCGGGGKCVNTAGIEGVCEPTGFCSFAEPGCASGRRYGEFAGMGLSGECVPSAAPDAPPAPPGDAAVDGSAAPDAVVCVKMGPEICNGLDDDCNDVTDEGFALDVACDGADMDLCNEGVTVCNAAGDGTECGDTSDDSLETCNTVDDNCNLIVDEGCGCGNPCDGPDGDNCDEGVVVCSPMGGTSCDDATSTTVETCNGVNDDCRDGVDDPWPLRGSACTVGVGACQRAGTWVCNMDQTDLECNATAGVPGVEYCGDGVDGDCSGGADPACPGGDTRATAVDVSASGTFTADVAFAHDDASPPCAGGGGRDVFFQFTLAADQVVYADTFGSTYDTVLKLENGPCTAAGASVACVNDSCSTTRSQLIRPTLAAGTYCLLVDAVGAAGTLTLHFAAGGRTAPQLATGASTLTGDTCASTHRSAPATCAYPAATAPDDAFWFTLCAGETRSLDAVLCGGATFDTVLYVRQGSVVTGADAGCNDDSTCGMAFTLQSTLVAVPVVGPGLFWLVMDGYYGVMECGPYTLGVTL